jgi:hypothetical protein
MGGEFFSMVEIWYTSISSDMRSVTLHICGAFKGGFDAGKV